MKTLPRIASMGSALVLPVLLVPAVWTQTPTTPPALPQGIEASSDTVQIKALHTWAIDHRQTNPDEAIEAAGQALALARRLDDQPRIAASLKLLGNLLYSHDLDRSEEYYLEAQRVFEQIGNERSLARNQINLGNVRKSRGDLEGSLTHYFEALGGFERLGDTEGRAKVLTNIGNTHASLGNSDEALRYYAQASALAETLDEPILLIYILDNFGVALAEQGAFEQAEVHLRRALAISERVGDKSSIASISNNLGYLLNNQGHHERALPFLIDARNVSADLGNNQVLIAAFDELGKAYLGLGQYDRALNYTRESLTLAQETGSMRSQMVAHQTLSKIYEAVGDDKRALFHHRRFAAARDSIFTTEKAEIIAELQTRYETEEQQRANERLQQENQIQALQLSLLLGAVLVALLVAGLFYYRYRVKQKANRLLEELDTAKSQFFENISHEFRTPLTVVLGGVQDALSGRYGVMPDGFVEPLRAMQRNAHQLQGLVSEVLALNRLETGRLEPDPSPGDLVRSLERIVVADAPLAERNGIDLTFESTIACCPRLYDEDMLARIVGNLLSNALKFTPKGGSVRVSLSCGGDTEISVTDSGPGIPADKQEEVFERFAQLNEDGHHGGTGIGLALAMELAELHGGTVELESTPGEGSVFTVRLPLATCSVQDIRTPGNKEPLSFETRNHENIQDITVDPRDDGTVEVEGDGAEQKDQWAPSESDRTTVLIIEDSDDVRAYVKRSLDRMYRVIEASTGDEGLQRAHSELPDLIVSDVMLPGVDGHEIARRLKADPDTECIPVVMLTARAAEEDRAEGYGSGAEIYITKPFAPATLRAAVARILEERWRLRRRIQSDAKSGTEEVSINGQRTLPERARAVLRENLHDEEFGVDELASALGMSRRTLYRHLEPETDLTPGDFIRAFRLERARRLLESGAGSVSEVAYAVGFKSLSHFTQSFRQQYDTLPSTLVATRAG